MTVSRMTEAPHHDGVHGAANRRRRVLMVSPHFPPDTSAGSHRVRLLAPHLARYNWEPTVVSVDPRDYESRLDPGLEALVPKSLRVIRCRAWPHRWTRPFGIGDLGLRALRGIERTCTQLLTQEPFDALFITIYPSYPALLGPRLKRRFRIPFVLDYQDPWVGAWGKSVGGGRNGRADMKSRMTRYLATTLEPRVVRHADAITAVSEGTVAEIRSRVPDVNNTYAAAIPLGGEREDFAYLRTHPRANPYFDPDDGHFHLCYVGTLLPLGFETLRAVLTAVGTLRDVAPAAFDRLRLHFFGTSNLTDPNATQRVIPVAAELGVAERVSEIAPRIDYLDALTVLTQASGVLMMGSTETHYTASKLYPGLLAQRPLLSVYNRASSVVDILASTCRAPSVHVVTYDDLNRAGSKVKEITTALGEMVTSPKFSNADVDFNALAQFSAESLAENLASVFDKVVHQ